MYIYFIFLDIKLFRIKKLMVFYTIADILNSMDFEIIGRKQIIFRIEVVFNELNLSNLVFGYFFE